MGKKRKREFSEEPEETTELVAKRLCQSSSESPPCRVMYKSLPLIHALPEVLTFYPSVIIQLQGMGIEPLAIEMAGRDLPLAGRLRYFIPNWAKITQDQWVLEAVRGYRVPFTQQPYQPHPPRALHHSSKEEELMQENIAGMLDKQAIEETTPRGRGFISTIFLVPKKDGGQRPVINLKSLNRFVHTEHFKMEGIHVLRDLLRAGDWMAKVDLKDANFMLPIRDEDRAFLKFSFKDRTYQFKCLPFGLACAPWAFTKTLKPMAALLRQLGMRLIVYIDDILILAESRDKARDHAMGLVYLLENLGFAVSKAKCQLEPTQNIEFLGFTVDSLKRELSLPRGKVKKYQNRHTIPARGQAGADQEIVPIIGQTAGSYKGGAPGTFVLSQAPASPEVGPRPVGPGLLEAASAFCRGARGTAVVAGPSNGLERQNHRDGKTVASDRVGRLHLRVGSDMRGSSHGRPVVSGGSVSATSLAWRH